MSNSDPRAPMTSLIDPRLFCLVSIAVDIIDRPSLRVAGAHVKERLHDTQIDCQNYAYEHGADKPEIDQGTWP